MARYASPVGNASIRARKAVTASGSSGSSSPQLSSCRYVQPVDAVSSAALAVRVIPGSSPSTMHSVRSMDKIRLHFISKLSPQIMIFLMVPCYIFFSKNILSFSK